MWIVADGAPAGAPSVVPPVHKNRRGGLATTIRAVLVASGEADSADVRWLADADRPVASTARLLRPPRNYNKDIA